MRLMKFIILILCLLTHFGMASQNELTVNDALKLITIIAYPENGRAVDRTAAEELKNEIVPNARILPVNQNSKIMEKGVMRISIADESLSPVPKNLIDQKDWMFFKIDAMGNGVLMTSKPSLLYALFCQLKENWLENNLAEFENGKILKPKFSWLRGDDGFFTGKKRFSMGYDPEGSIKELARMGCSHVVINSLATPFSMEQGPPGEIYYRFYISAPDLDQFVETEFNKGTYPPEYLEANFNFLKEQAKLAIKYGLSPGLYICDPRSVPESLLEKYPFLRGARVDHPFRSYRPRFTLTLGHPLVRWHYAEMLRKIMTAIPEISFVNTFLNDSGSGFEYTARLYSGRNGGAYIAREWMPHEAFAEAASANIIRYYRMLRDVGREINPEFRIIAGLFAIPEEEPLVLKGMDNGIDLEMSINDKNDKQKWAREQELVKRGSYLFTSTSAKGALVQGIPLPWKTIQSLQALSNSDLTRISVAINPPSVAPYDINREVVKAYQFGSTNYADEVIQKTALKWVGQGYAPRLIEIWRSCDEAVSLFPDIPLYGTSWAFEMYRLWVRPFVPDIGKVPESEREYYEKYTMAVFNNPHLVDLAKDALWTLITTEQGDQIVRQFDAQSKPALEQAIQLAEKTVNEIPLEKPEREIFIDLRDRMLALRCYYKTLRNVGAWVAGVHGFLEAKNEDEKSSRLKMVREMMDDELENARDLLKLWQSTKVNFIPINQYGESWHEYGENLGELIEKKIALMEKHRNDLPYIDPDFMWRMPKEYKYFEEKYLGK
jgi:hypothetical protein